MSLAAWKGVSRGERTFGAACAAYGLDPVTAWRSMADVDAPTRRMVNALWDRLMYAESGVDPATVTSHTPRVRGQRGAVEEDVLAVLPSGKRGAPSIRHIAAQSGRDRSSVYSALQRLMHRGQVARGRARGGYYRVA